MPVEESILYSILERRFPNSIIKITDLAGDKDHYSVEIISILFKDKSLIEQHRLVNKAIKEELGDELHAIAIKTRINSEL